MTGTIVVGFAMLAIGATGGFVIALVARRLTRPAAPRTARAAGRAVGAVVMEESEESPPSLVLHQGPGFELHESLTPMPIPAYDPENESEDDVPTTLYRHQDEDLEALLGELDTGHNQS